MMGVPTPPTVPAPPSGHTAGTTQTLNDLRELRPERVESYEAALPAARAKVLARVLGALGRESLPGIARRELVGDTLRVTLADGRLLTAPGAAALPFADPPAGLTVEFGAAHDDPAALLRSLPLGPRAGRLAEELDNSVA